MLRQTTTVALLAAALCTIPALGLAQDNWTGEVGEGVPAFEVRPGYRVTLAYEVDDPRFVEFGDDGTLYLSRPKHEDILALRDTDGDGRFDWQETYVSGHPFVQGLHFVDGLLWFSETDAIFKSQDKNGDGVADVVEKIIGEDVLPGGTGHWWRALLVTDEHIYTSVGDRGNISDPEGDRQKVWRFNLDGSGKTLWSTGVRNTEKLRLRPGTDEVWGVDHGSDWYGRELGERSGFQPVTDWNPGDEFNHYRQGEFYGHPWIVGSILPRIEYYGKEDILDLAARTQMPAWLFGAHWAANSFTFITKDHFPADHQGDAFVACRGSWNRSVKAGYRVERVLWDEVTGLPYGSMMIVGTLVDNDENVLARPVDCTEAPDGTILFTSDTTDRIFRIEYVGDN